MWCSWLQNAAGHVRQAHRASGQQHKQDFFVLLLLLSRLFGRKHYLYLYNDLKVYSREMNLEAERKVVRKDVEGLVLSSAQICSARSQATNSKAPGSLHGDPALSWVWWGRARSVCDLSYPEGSVSAGQTYSPRGPGGALTLEGSGSRKSQWHSVVNSRLW